MYYDLGSFITADGDRLRDLEAERESAGRCCAECERQVTAASRHYRQSPTSENRRRKEIAEALAARAAREHNLLADKVYEALQDAQWQAVMGW